LFEDAWAATFYDYLTKTTNDRLAERFVALITEDMLRSWGADEIAEWSPQILKAILEGKSNIFRDESIGWEAFQCLWNNEDPLSDFKFDAHPAAQSILTTQMSEESQSSTISIGSIQPSRASERTATY
jgi:hypothetical protein